MASHLFPNTLIDVQNYYYYHLELITLIFVIITIFVTMIITQML
jgi:hypothetical protein